MANDIPRYIQEMYILFLLLNKDKNFVMSHSCVKDCIQIFRIGSSNLLIDIHRISVFLENHDAFLRSPEDSL